jgi:hypothetical protein
MAPFAFLPFLRKAELCGADCNCKDSVPEWLPDICPFFGSGAWFGLENR